MLITTVAKAPETVIIAIRNESKQSYEIQKIKRLCQRMDLPQGGSIMKSYVATASSIERKWYVVDATGHTLGRLASEVAKVLRGKHKPVIM